MSPHQGTGCRVCEADTAPFGEAVVLGRHRVTYFRCPSCGFVQTEEPHWLADAYLGAINDTDVGLVSRNHLLSVVTRTLIRVFFEARGQFLDYGGGYGLFVRLMRDAGYDFHRYDPFCPNLFAKGLDTDLADGPFELMTAFEVIEHLVDPIGSLEEMLTASDSILVGTETLPNPAPQPDEWWYYGLEHGQHISIFGKTSLERAAAMVGVRLYTNGKNLHLFTRRRLPSLGFAILSKYRVGQLLTPFTRRASLQPGDFERLLDEH